MPERASNVSLNALRAFEVVARLSSVSRAASELGVTHGAVSRLIAGLEGQLGVILFSRHKNRLTLTDEGCSLFADVAPAFECLRTAVQKVQTQAGPSTLLINVPPSFAMHWLISRLPSFQRRKPQVEIRLTTGKSPIAQAQRPGVDLVVRRLPGRSAARESVPFLSARLVPVCAPELLEQRPIVHPRDVRNHVLLHSSPRAADWPEWFQKAGIQGILPRSEIVFEEIYFAIQAAVDGMGIALVPLPLVADGIAAGQLCMPVDLPGVGRRDYHYVVTPSSANIELARDFGQWLCAQGSDSDRFAAELITGLFSK